MPLIDNLLALYKVDRQARSLRGRLESAEIYLNLQKKQLKVIELERSENDQFRMHRQATLANIETEIASITERIEHLREELTSAVNDKQYSALLAEVNTLKERSKAFEDEALIEIAAIDELEQTADDINNRKDERKKVEGVAAKELETRKLEVADRLAELDSERTTAAAVIPADDLAVFDEIADDYDGEAMAAIEVIDLKRREYSCTSCSLRLPIDSITTLMSNNSVLVRCVSCDRILYLEAETRELMIPKS